MRRWAAVLLTGLLLAGCGGGGGGGDADDKGDAAAPRSSTTAVTTTTAVAVAGSASTAPAAGGSSATTSAAGRTAPAPTGGARQLSPATPGTYTLDQTGTSHVRGCLTQDRPAPTPVKLTVDPPQGQRQRTVRDEGDEGGRATSVLEFRADGVYLVSLRQETPGLGTIEFEPAAPVLAFPADPQDGRRWQYALTSKDGKYKADTTNVVEAAHDQARLGDGRTVGAARLRIDAHVTGTSTFGPVDFKATSVSWVSPELRLIARDVTDTNGSAGACKIESHVEGVLHSATPA